MRGYSLPEFAIATLIGFALIGSALHFSRVLVFQTLHQRHQATSAIHVRMARMEIHRALTHHEPHFWRSFPPRHSPIHDADGAEGGYFFRHQCPRSSGFACLQAFDLMPPDTPRPLYTCTNDGRRIDTEGWIRLEPTTLDATAAWPQPGEVLLFHGPERSFCAAIGDAVPPEFRLVGPDRQVWHRPEAFNPSDTTITSLGSLSVHHWYLQPEPERDQELVHRSWHLGRNGWHPRRGQTSFSMIHAMHWLPAEGNLTHRLALVGRSRIALDRPTPLVLGSHVYRKEVHCAILEL